MLLAIVFVESVFALGVIEHFCRFVSDCTDHKLGSRPCPPAACPRRRPAVGSAGRRGFPLLFVSSAPSTWPWKERPVRSRSETQCQSGFPAPAYHAGLQACRHDKFTLIQTKVKHSVIILCSPHQQTQISEGVVTPNSESHRFLHLCML